jgi:hypothetical protein
MRVDHITSVIITAELTVDHIAPVYGDHRLNTLSASIVELKLIARAVLTLYVHLTSVVIGRELIALSVNHLNTHRAVTHRARFGRVTRTGRERERHKRGE